MPLFYFGRTDRKSIAEGGTVSPETPKKKKKNPLPEAGSEEKKKKKRGGYQYFMGSYPAQIGTVYVDRNTNLGETHRQKQAASPP